MIYKVLRGAPHGGITNEDRGKEGGRRVDCQRAQARRPPRISVLSAVEPNPPSPSGAERFSGENWYSRGVELTGCLPLLAGA